MRRQSKPRATRRNNDGRASWRGMLRFGLVAFPVQAINAHAPDEGHYAFHQLHVDCGRRIHYEKHCPVHGEVSNDEIISGYEYGMGKYVEIEPEELNELRSEKDKALTIDTFIEPEDFDPLYFDGRMYYLIPDGEGAGEPFSVFLMALERQGRYGVGQVVFSGKEQVVLVRPYENVLHMAMLNYDAEMRSAEKTAAALPMVRGADRKVHMAEQLIHSWTADKFDFTEYVDRYQEQVRELIEAKIAGRKVVQPEPEEEPEVINLMDALRKSMSARHATKRSHDGAKQQKSPRKKGRTTKSRSARHTKAG
jgi:DNA end-binding protein Ku